MVSSITRTNFHTYEPYTPYFYLSFCAICYNFRLSSCLYLNHSCTYAAVSADAKFVQHIDLHKCLAAIVVLISIMAFADVNQYYSLICVQQISTFLLPSEVSAVGECSKRQLNQLYLFVHFSIDSFLSSSLIPNCRVIRDYCVTEIIFLNISITNFLTKP